MSEERILIENLLRRIESLEKEIATRDAIIAAQALKIKELEEKLNKNSQNSSKPPSSDGYKRSHSVINREKTGKKPGARVQIPPSAPTHLRVYGGGFILLHD